MKFLKSFETLSTHNSAFDSSRVQLFEGEKAFVIVAIDDFHRLAYILFISPLRILGTMTREIVENVQWGQEKKIRETRAKARLRGSCQLGQPFKSNLTIKLLFTPAHNWLILLIICLSRCPSLNRRVGKLHVTST